MGVLTVSAFSFNCLILFTFPNVGLFEMSGLLRPGLFEMS